MAPPLPSLSTASRSSRRLPLPAWRVSKLRPALSSVSVPNRLPELTCQVVVASVVPSYTLLVGSAVSTSGAALMLLVVLSISVSA
ncbi:hypothetical protein D9M68_884590 [compost metagenome]